MLPQDDKEAHYELTGNGTKYNKHWQIAGELYGAAVATRWCIQNGYTHLDLYYDYLGVEKWATCEWKRRQDIAVQYSMTMRDYMCYINMKFHKVKAHTGDRFNELADKLAKDAYLHYRIKFQKERINNLNKEMTDNE